jgi:hypothetical protein
MPQRPQRNAVTRLAHGPNGWATLRADDVARLTRAAALCSHNLQREWLESISAVLARYEALSRTLQQELAGDAGETP